VETTALSDAHLLLGIESHSGYGTRGEKLGDETFNGYKIIGKT